uniref:Uncharacterized protein n=1 Tax=Anguilla anguilla TaxID=7936 RepID=A0A0E9R6A8_ANGAN
MRLNKEMGLFRVASVRAGSGRMDGSSGESDRWRNEKEKICSSNQRFP